jgi:hypothetical protein
MSTKTFSFNTVIPRITSITKSDSKKTVPNRAKGKVLVVRSASSSSSRSNSRIKINASSFVGFASAAGLVAIVVALGFYVYMINAYASKGYELKRQQAVIKELTDTNKKLVIQQAAQSSIVRVNDVAATSGMVPVTGEEFLVASQLSAR